MATKAKTLQVKDKEKDDKAADAPEKDSPDAPSPLLDLSDAAVKKMIKQAKKRGFVTFDQLNEVLPSDTTSPEQIEDIMSMLSDMGINVSEAEDADSEEENKEEAEDETDNELVEVTQKAVTEVKKSEPGERTDDPVRMYLREMGTVELLSREGEIAIAKRIEAGREAMIAGLCESPLTFQAIIIWRDELNEGKIFLRDIIDLEATYAGPDAKNNMNPLLAAPLGPDGQPLVAANGNGEAAMPAAAAPPAAPPSATPVRAPPGGARPRAREESPRRGRGRIRPGRRRVRKPDVARGHRGRAEAEGGRDFRQDRRQLQEDAAPAGTGYLQPAAERIAVALAGAQIQEAEGRNHRRGEVAAAQPGPHRFAGRAALRHQQEAGVVRGPPAAARRQPRRRPRGFPAQLSGLGARSALAQPCLETFGKRLEEFRASRKGPHQGTAPRDSIAGGADRARDRRIPQDRARRAEGRARGAPGQEGNGRGQPAAGDFDRQEIHQTRPAITRSDPGRQYRPDEGGRQIRIPPRLQVLDLRDLVDSAGDHAKHRRSGPHHPHSRAHDRDHQQDRAHLAPDAERDRPRTDAGGIGRKTRHAAGEGPQGSKNCKRAAVSRNSGRRRGRFASRRFHRGQERDPPHRRRDPVQPARNHDARPGLADATRRTRPPHALRHRHEHRPHFGRSRPAVLGDQRAHPADRSQGAAQAEASVAEQEAAELFGQLEFRSSCRGLTQASIDKKR